jgi:hypothetical protein
VSGPDGAAPRRSRWARAAAALGGGALGLLTVELALRLAAGALQIEAFAGFDDARTNPIYRASPTRGYEPVPGAGGYNEHGVLDYGYSLPRRERLLRILVLGDSVAHRRLWIEGLERRLQAFVGPEAAVEVWNAGVEGYNTVQEAVYLREQGQFVRADLVLVQFHLNDFLPLPVLFQDNTGQIAYLPFESELGSVSQPLFELSFLYRYLLLRWRPTRDARQQTARRQVDRAVAEIQELCRGQKMDLVFVIFPLFKAEADYQAAERHWHRWILEILRARRVDHVDLHGAYPRDRGIEALRETPEDPWHPNPEGHRIAARVLADSIRRRGLVRRLQRQARGAELQRSTVRPRGASPS